MISCRFCGGRGCIACPVESKTPKTIFVASLDNPGDMALLNDAVGAKALSKAFGPEGRGMDEIGQNLAIANVLQEMRKRITINVGEKDE